MGSVSPRIKVEFARALLTELERESRSSIAANGEIDVPALAGILDAALDNLAHRDAVVFFLAAYLSRCLTGSVPDHTRWNPPQ